MGRHKQDPVEAILVLYRNLTTDQQADVQRTLKYVAVFTEPPVPNQYEQHKRIRKPRTSLGQAGIPPTGLAG